MQDKRHYKLLILIFALAFLISICPGIYGCIKEKDAGSGEISDKDPAGEAIEKNTETYNSTGLSADQNKLVSMIGYPDEFIIMFDTENNNSRIETWIYGELQSSFNFRDGIFDSRETSPPRNLADDSCNLNPEDFNFGMSPEEVNVMIGEQSEELIDPETGLKVLVFGKGILACTFNGENKLFVVARLKNVLPQGD